MRFTETVLPGSYLIDVEPIEDERGFFARTWSREEFEERGLDANIAQCSVSFNRKRGTVRGLHYQAKPHEEVKIVWCIAGAINDVIVDLRPQSPAYKKWVAVHLTASHLRMLYIPEGLAHGFQTLEDNTEVYYQISQLYRPESARGVRWNDPAFEIDWPLPVSVMSERDLNFPDYHS